MVLERKGRVSNKCVLQKGTATIRKGFHVLQYTTAYLVKLEGRLFAPANISLEMYLYLQFCVPTGSKSRYELDINFEKRSIKSFKIYEIFLHIF
jgi:hypothetical protein